MSGGSKMGYRVALRHVDNSLRRLVGIGQPFFRFLPPVPIKHNK